MFDKNESKKQQLTAPFIPEAAAAVMTPLPDASTVVKSTALSIPESAAAVTSSLPDASTIATSTVSPVTAGASTYDGSNQLWSVAIK
jgi:hypothetical protein